MGQTAVVLVHQVGVDQRAAVVVEVPVLMAKVIVRMGKPILMETWGMHLPLQ